MTIDLAISLGSCSTVIFKKDEGIVLREASVVATESTKTGERIIAVGNKAYQMIDRVPESIQVISPIQNGKVVNEKLAGQMVKEFILKIARPSILTKIFCLVTVDASIGNVDLNLLKRVIYSAGVSQVKFVPALICSAIAMGADILSGSAHAVLNMGAGSTEIGVINYCSIIAGGSVAFGGASATDAVRQLIKSHHKIDVSFATAEKIKLETLTLFENDGVSTSFVGASVNGTGQAADIFTGKQAFTALKPVYTAIAKSAEHIVNTCKPEIIADIAKNGIFVTGGASQVSGLRQFFTNLLGYTVVTDDDSENAVILGAGKLLSDVELLNNVLKNN